MKGSECLAWTLSPSLGSHHRRVQSSGMSWPDLHSRKILLAQITEGMREKPGKPMRIYSTPLSITLKKPKQNKEQKNSTDWTPTLTRAQDFKKCQRSTSRTFKPSSRGTFPSFVHFPLTPWSCPQKKIVRLAGRAYLLTNTHGTCSPQILPGAPIPCTPFWEQAVLCDRLRSKHTMLFQEHPSVVRERRGLSNTCSRLVSTEVLQRPLLRDWRQSDRVERFLAPGDRVLVWLYHWRSDRLCDLGKSLTLLGLRFSHL